MAIPESQLETWAKQGSITQSASTYATIKNALEANDTGYAGRTYKVFLQGSYCNDTNVWAESDVDIVIRLDSMFHYDIDALTSAEKQAFENAFPGGPPAYTYANFKDDVVKALNKRFGQAVVGGEKAVKINADGGRRNADVIISTEFRRYRKFPPATNDMDMGMCFFAKGNQRIANYPQAHSANCTTKHQSTKSSFKPMVRILKNMRNRLVNDGTLDSGIAPSYYIEGLIYNVPDDLFASTYGATFVAAVNWLLKADKSKLVCANWQYYLFGNSAVQWSEASSNVFLTKVIELWNDWQ